MITGLGEAGPNIVICSRKLKKCATTAHEVKKLVVRFHFCFSNPRLKTLNKDNYNGRIIQYHIVQVI